MKEYDVIVIGAGPAGGQCARELSRQGRGVCLVEKAKDFTVNNFSTAGAPLSIMHDYSLPKGVVGSFWNQFMIQSGGEKKKWVAYNPKGVVLDFMKLRSFLAQQVALNGGEVLLGTPYRDHMKDRVFFANGVEARCRVLVDATGSDRAVLAKGVSASSKSVALTGIEKLIEVPSSVYETWAKTLSFFIGTDWMPQGYAWIFPMAPNQLKVGIGRYFHNIQHVPHKKSHRFYLDEFVKKCFHRSDLPVLDQHGKTLRYTYGRRDRHFDEHVIAVGDTVSTVNPLAGEGIRHAMYCGRCAAKHIGRYLDGKISSFRSYGDEIEKHFGWKWWASEKMMHQIYCQPDEKKMDLIVRALGTFSFDELIDWGFNYRGSKMFKFMIRYMALCGLRKIKPK